VCQIRTDTRLVLPKYRKFGGEKKEAAYAPDSQGACAVDRAQ